MTPTQQFVRYALVCGAFELYPEEPKRLRDGRKSPYYFDSNRLCSGKALAMAGELFAEACREVHTPERQVVYYGPAYKAIPLAVATVEALWRMGIEASYAFDRKEVHLCDGKTPVEGAPLHGKTVVVVDNAITTGGSMHEAITTIREAGGEVVDCWVLFDRMERYTKESVLSPAMFLRQTHHVDVRAIATLDDLVTVLTEDDGACFPLGPATLPRIAAYREKYGV